MAGDGGPKAGSKEARLLASSFLYLMFSQIAARALSFLLSVLTDRRLSAAEIGVSAIQFPLITTSILMISREGFRRGCIRSDFSGKESGEVQAAQAVNVAWLTVPIGTVVTAGACTLILWWQGLPLTDHKAQAVLLLGVAAIVELLSEPLYIRAQSLLLIRVRSTIETAATMTKCVSTYLMLLAGIGQSGGLVFAYAQLVYAACLLGGYWGYFLFNKTSTLLRPPLLPRLMKSLSPSLGSSKKGGAWLDKGLLRLCGAFSWQSVEKLALGEGEKFVLVLSGSVHNQGVYGLVEKLGSLVVRTVLQPFEESAFTTFAKAAPLNEKDGKGERDKRGVERVLLVAIKVVSLIGLVFVAFGPAYSYVLLRLLYSRDKSETEAPRALAAYCIYVFVMAVNGITEAFLHASVSERELAWSNGAMVFFSALHVSLSIALIRAAGSTGLVLANCCNMCLRVSYSVLFMHHYFKDSKTFSLRRAFPSFQVLAALAGAAATVLWSERTLLSRDNFAATVLVHIGVGILCFGAVLAFMYRAERRLVRDLRELQGEPQQVTSQGAKQERTKVS